MTHYLPHVKLTSIATGQAEVRLFTPFSPDVPFGSSRSLGWVRRQKADTRWLAVDAEQSLVGCHFSTRQAAVDHLVALNKKEAASEH